MIESVQRWRQTYKKDCAPSPFLSAESSLWFLFMLDGDIGKAGTENTLLYLKSCMGRNHAHDFFPGSLKFRMKGDLAPYHLISDQKEMQIKSIKDQIIR